MRLRSTIVAVLIFLAILLTSCSSDVSDTNVAATAVSKPSSSTEYGITSNVKSISTGSSSSAIVGGSVASRSLDDQIGDPIIGVLLKFTGDGAWSTSGKNFAPADESSFALFCFFDTYYNGDNMAYNYVLFVPEEIRTAYTALTGDTKRNGNPFWWYMRVYNKMQKNEIKNDYYSALKLLLESEELPRPDISAIVKPVELKPSTDKSFALWSTVRSISENTGDAANLVGDPSSSLLVKSTSENRWGYGKTGEVVESKADNVFTLYCVDTSYLSNPDREYNYVLYVPASIETAYTYHTGRTGMGDAFLWYTTTYLNYTGTILDKALPEFILNAESFPIPTAL